MTSARVLLGPGADAALARAYHLGDGLFETVLVADGRPCLLAAHLARLAASGRALGVPVPAGLAPAIAGALPALLLRERRPARAALRISVSRGVWAGLEPDAAAAPSVVLALRALGPAPGSLSARIVAAPRIDPASPLAGHKVLSWMDKVEARRRARADGADVALLRTIDGDLAEADSANLFAAVGGVLVTPPLGRGVLPGITRARVLAAARARGVPAAERPLGDGDLAAAAEAFLTSSLAGVVPLHSLDGRPLPAGPLAAAMARDVLPEGRDETDAGVPAV